LWQPISDDDFLWSYVDGGSAVLFRPLPNEVPIAGHWFHEIDLVDAMPLLGEPSDLDFISFERILENPACDGTWQGREIFANLGGFDMMCLQLPHFVRVS
jgi:hypothetical protein